METHDVEEASDDRTERRLWAVVLLERGAVGPRTLPQPLHVSAVIDPRLHLLLQRVRLDRDRGVLTEVEFVLDGLVEWHQLKYPPLSLLLVLFSVTSKGAHQG